MTPEKNTKKIYVLDTNVLLHDPYAYKNFEGVQVGIPAVVLEELDNFKREATDRGRNAREFIRQLDELRERGSLRKGVEIENGTNVQVLFVEDESLDIPFRIDKEDNLILLAALELLKKGFEVKFISKDINARVKADALGIRSEDYLKEFVTEEEFYKGWAAIDVPAVELKTDQPSILQKLVKDYELTINQFILLKSQHNPYNYRIFRYMGSDIFHPVYPPSFKWPLKSRNPQQTMALNLLLDDSVQFVTLLGPAGTGKTFLALLAGLHKILIKDDFRKLLVSRPVIPLGRDLGYLPGTLEEKLHSWMLPIYDNMEFIMHSINLEKHVEDLKDNHQKKKAKKHTQYYRRDKTGIAPVDELVHQGKLSLEAITYMRGRSIPYQYILIDEAQNLTPHEVKTIITRVGVGSKVILAGDPYQIDSPYLDFSSNGLVSASEKFKGQRIFGSVFLETSERSELSQLAGNLL